MKACRRPGKGKCRDKCRQKKLQKQAARLSDEPLNLNGKVQNLKTILVIGIDEYASLDEDEQVTSSLDIVFDSSSDISSLGSVDSCSLRTCGITYILTSPSHNMMMLCLTSYIANTGGRDIMEIVLAIYTIDFLRRVRTEARTSGAFSIGMTYTIILSLASITSGAATATYL